MPLNVIQSQNVMRKTTFLKELKEIEIVINKCDTCHVAMVDENNKPYVLPFNFGYNNGVVYLHSDQKGRKIDILKNNPAVCINFTADHEMFHQNEKVACSYGMRYRSVLIHGNVEFINDFDEKVDALNIFMKQYVKDMNFKYSDPAVNNVCVFKVEAKDFIGKMYGHEDLK